MNAHLKTIPQEFIFKKVTIAPLVTFRILFGLLMLASMIRFAANGWIKSQYIDPALFFPFIEGIRPLTGSGMYGVFMVLGITALFIALGLFYRLSCTAFFLLFTYVELIDKTNYLNHYYFVSIISFLLIWVPAHRMFSLDVMRKAVPAQNRIAIGFINVLRIQLGIVYFFAGIAKINYDWLINAQPLKLWLSAQVHKPVLGELFRFKATAYVFSWFGMLYDISIPFLLSIKKLLPYTYFLVIAFHLITWWLFPIGMFPFIMIVATTIFFPFAFHEGILKKLQSIFKVREAGIQTISAHQPRMTLVALSVFLILQMVLPLRSLVYPGNVSWNETGYRFSWRVMLMEKAGQATFYVTDGDKKDMVANYEYLTPQQEKMMATQPDMILQFAQFLEKEYRKKGFSNPEVRVDSFVTLNGRPHKRFIDPTVDLGSETIGKRENWILAYD